MISLRIWQSFALPVTSLSRTEEIRLRNTKSESLKRGEGIKNSSERDTFFHSFLQHRIRARGPIRRTGRAGLLEVLALPIQDAFMVARAVLVAVRNVRPAPVLGSRLPRSRQRCRRGRCVGFSQQSREGHSGWDHEESRCNGHFRLHQFLGPGARMALGENM